MCVCVIYTTTLSIEIKLVFRNTKGGTNNLYMKKDIRRMSE